MRLPWIQVDKAGIAKCRVLAQLLKIPVPHGIGLGTMLWEWAFELAPDGDFTGVVPDAELLVAALEWPAEDGPRLVTQLQRVGMIATHPTLRVRGLDRYRAAWEKNQRRNGKPVNFGSRVPATGDNPPGLFREPSETARKTETETETEKKQKRAGVPPVPKPAKVKPPVDPRHAPLRARLVEIFQARRGIAYPFKPRDAAAIRDLLGAAEPEVVTEAWARALDHRGWPTVSSLSELHQHLAHFVGAGAPPPGKPEFDPNQGIIRSGGPPTSRDLQAMREDPFPWSRP